MIAGHIVTMAPDGKLEHFPVVGYVVVGATLTATVHHVEGEAGHRAARGDGPPERCVGRLTAGSSRACHLCLPV